jgi:hypothetical protein
VRALARYAPAAWALALAVLLLGPALGAGYLLTYDMVWVPDLALRPDFLGAGTALPRAVPSDAVVAVLDEVVPGMVLQKVVLLGALVLGGLGAAALVDRSVPARLTATSVYVWSPFVVERVWIGHWPLLLCWAVLPWLVREGVRLRADPRVGAALPLLLLAGSLSANAGLMAAATVLAVGLTRRSAARLVALVVAANAPWLVAGLLHLDTATSSVAGAVFGLDAEGPLPAPLAALSLGGIWNAEVVPASRETLVLPLALAVAFVALAAAGLRPLADRLGRRTTGALVGLWVAGYALAVLSWAAPGAVGSLAALVPGGGLLRDGTRSLVLCAPLTAALVASGVASVAARCAGRTPRLLVATAGALLPLAFLPDAAWGVSGALRPASYPDSYAAARTALADAPQGDLLVLPFTSYRQPGWNHDGKVLDPLPRYLPADYLVNDQLVVDGRVIAGEDPRVPETLAALAAPDPQARAEALGRLGVSVVVRELGVPAGSEYDAPVAGTELVAGPDLEVLRLDAPVSLRETSGVRRAVLALGWAAFLLLPLLGGWRLVRSSWSRTARTRRSG